MIKVHSKIAAAFLALTMLFAMVPMTVFAAEDSSPPVSEAFSADISNNDLEITGEDSFGELLANTINEYTNDAGDSSAQQGYAVTGVEMEGTTATVEYGALENSILVVAIYDNDGGKMLGSGRTMAAADKQQAVVEIEIDEMPQYYLVKAFLLNPSTNAPLSAVYSNELHTKGIQEIEQATIEDFPDKQVLNLDGDNTTNFAVYRDDVAVLKQSNNANIYDLASSDPDNGKYVFMNADSQFTSLKVGDTFSHQNGTEITIVKIASIDVVRNANGTYTVAVTEDKNVDMEDVFDVVKINNNGKINSYNIDDSSADPLVYGGAINPIPNGSSISPRTNNVGITEINGEYDAIDITRSLINDDESETTSDKHLTIKVKMSVSLNLKVFVAVKVYISTSERYVEAKVGVSATVDGTVNGTVTLNSISLCDVGISPVPGVYIGFTPQLEFSMSASATINASYKHTAGFKYTKNEGFSDISDPFPVVDLGGKVEITIFMGINFKPAIRILSEHVAEASLNAKVGVEITGTMEGKIDSSGKLPNELHSCERCVDGDFNFVFDLSAKVKFFEKKDLTFSAQIIPEKKIKIGDWYYSEDLDEFGFTTCPHIVYKITATVADLKGGSINGIAICSSDNLTTALADTNESGKCEFYLYNGKYTLVAIRDGKQVATSDIEVKNKAQAVTLMIFDEDNPGGDTPGGGTPGSDTPGGDTPGGDTPGGDTPGSDTPGGNDPADTDTSAVISTGSCGDNMTYTLHESGLLFISGSGKMSDYRSYGSNISPWYNDRNYVKTVKFNGNITSIGEYAFRDCSNLTNVDIPNSVISIGQVAFCICNSLKSITIPNSVTTIGESAFSSCSNLESITISNSVTSIESYAFNNCTSLKNITIPDSVTSIGYCVFQDCSGLTSVTMPNAITDIDRRTFYNCTSLKSITIPDSVTSIGEYAFYNCNSLSEVILSNSLTSINDSAFGFCSNLKNITIPTSVTSIGTAAFSHCTSLTSITIPNSVTSIGYGVFQDCSGLTSVTIPNTITSIGYITFYNCTSLKNITIPNSVTSIGQKAFSYCTSLTSVTIPNSVTFIDRDAFSSCSSLKSITLPNSITSINSDTFSYCTSLTSVTIPNSITSIETNAFLSTALESVVIPDSVTFIGSLAFRSNNMKDVYYTGSESAWNKISIESDTEFYRATIHYNYTPTSGSGSTNAAAFRAQAAIRPVTTSAVGVVNAPLALATLSQTVSFDNLEADTDYLMAIFKTENTDDLFAPDNLLYIDQKTAGISGSLTFAYELREEFANPVIKLFGTTRQSIVDALVTAPTLAYTGAVQYPAITVTLNGQQLTKGVDYILSGTTSASEAGTHAFTVTGIGDYKDTVSGEFIITATELALNLTEVNMRAGTDFTPKLFLYPSDSRDSITWTSSNSSIAAVDQNGKITAIAKGKATITASAESGNTASIKVSVASTSKETKSITIAKPSLKLTITRSKLNPTATLTAKITGGNTGKTWFSDDINVATVTKAGKVTAVGEGTANIYCRTEYGLISAPCPVTVENFMIDSDNVRSNIVYVNALDTCHLTMNSTSDHGAVTWKSSNAKTAYIDMAGNVAALKKGTVTITATAADKTKDTVKLIVVQPSAGISLKSTSATIYAGKTVTLKATLSTKGSNDPVFWQSSNPSVATVTAKGVVKGIRQGKTTVTATTFNGQSVTATITVRSKATGIEFTQTANALYPNGNTGKFTAKITAPANSNDTITWTSSNKKVLEIVKTGADGKTITVKSGVKGTSTVTAKTGSGKRVSMKVTVVGTPATNLTLNTQSVDLYVGKTATVKVSKKEPKSADDSIFWWSSDNESIAKVDAGGKITGIAPGQTTVTGRSLGGIEKTVTVNIRQKATAITVNTTSATVQAGKALTLNVTDLAPAGCNDKITWTSSSKAIATVTQSSDGMYATVTGVKKGTATITVKTGSGKSQKIKITVTD